MISLLVVNYRSADLAAEAIQSARASTTEPLHVVVVDNSCDAVEAERIRPDVDELIVSATNRGYAGAINDGRRHCRGEIVLVANPDVVFAPHAIDRLGAALQRPGRAVAGPALYWDAAHQWILPPADARTLAEKLDEVAASRIAAWRRARDRRRFRERLAFWQLEDITPVRAISGAVMAIRLDDFDSCGGFDERFRLYFEESDFLRRVARRGREIVYVPAARCRHLYNQSAGSERHTAAAVYDASERAYWTKWYGRRTAALLMSSGRESRAAVFEPCGGSLRLARPGLVVEASPLPSFSTAAGYFSQSGDVALPAEVWASYRGGALYLRAVDPATARPVAACVRYRS